MCTKSILFHFLLLSLLISCSDAEKTNAANESKKDKTTMPSTPKSEITTITFPSLDGLQITADLYHVADDAPVFVLCHQARYNRTEHTETAKTLMGRGYKCLATDQRSGGVLNEQENATHQRAIAKGLPTNYIDAEQDIIAAVNYMAERYSQEVILVGSSYSAALGLKVAKENPNVKAILSFSPGEYFGDQLALGKTIAGLDKPTFITSSREEATTAKPLADVVNASQITHFVPSSEGAHGSRVLWSEQPFSDEYWAAVDAFLEKHSL
ncbi:MAG: dienelactone hydrolase family protein [Bacteroidota bacterium]